MRHVTRTAGWVTGRKRVVAMKPSWATAMFLGRVHSARADNKRGECVYSASERKRRLLSTGVRPKEDCKLMKSMDLAP